jgi:hypothetical protein
VNISIGFDPVDAAGSYCIYRGVGEKLLLRQASQNIVQIDFIEQFISPIVDLNIRKGNTKA